MGKVSEAKAFPQTRTRWGIQKVSVRGKTPWGPARFQRWRVDQTRRGVLPHPTAGPEWLQTTRWSRSRWMGSWGTCFLHFPAFSDNTPSHCYDHGRAVGMGRWGSILTGVLNKGLEEQKTLGGQGVVALPAQALFQLQGDCAGDLPHWAGQAWGLFVSSDFQ